MLEGHPAGPAAASEQAQGVLSGATTPGVSPPNRHLLRVHPELPPSQSSRTRHSLETQKPAQLPRLANEEIPASGPEQ